MIFVQSTPRSFWLVRKCALIFIAFGLAAGCATSDNAKNGNRQARPHVKVGNPYTIDGRRYYTPKVDKNYRRVGTASWYGPKFHGRLTANGEIFDRKLLTAAHKTLPLPTLVRVENLENGKRLVVRVNDRGPFVDDRIIDLSEAAARELGFRRKGLAKVRVTYLSEASLKTAGRNPPQRAAKRTKVRRSARRATARSARRATAPVEAAGRRAERSLVSAAPAVSRAAVAPSFVAAKAPDRFWIDVARFDTWDETANAVAALPPSYNPAVFEADDNVRSEAFLVRVGPLKNARDADTLRARPIEKGFSRAVVSADYTGS